MNKAAVAFAFIFGAVAGSVTAWYFTKKTYEQIAQQEIDSVKETFSKLYKRDDSVYEGPQDASEEEEDEEDPDKEEYAAIAHREGYITPTDIEAHEPAQEDKYDPPYVIAPESLDELEGYSVYTYTYYSCGTLVDEAERVVEEWEELVGFVSQDDLERHFGEYEDDSIAVRNDRLKCDIEILFDRRTYADVLAKEPYKAEV